MIRILGVVRIAVFGIWTFATVCLAQDLPTRAISEALTVSNQTDGCMSQEALINHIVRWLKTDHIEADIHIKVEVQGEKEQDVSFKFFRNEELTAHRSFSILPANCFDRLEAVSLAIALAIDHTVLEGLEYPTANPPIVPPITNDKTEEPVDKQDLPVTVSQESGKTPEDQIRQTKIVESKPKEVTQKPSIETIQENKIPPYTERPKQEDSRNIVELEGFAGVLALIEVLPKFAVGAVAGVSLNFGDLVSVRASGLFTSDVKTSLGNGNASLQLIAGRLDGCLLWYGYSLYYNLCAGTAAGALFTNGMDFEQNLTTQRPWVAALGQAAVGWPQKSTVGLRLSLDGVVPLLRPRVRVVTTNGDIIDELQTPEIGVFVSLQFFVMFW